MIKHNQNGAVNGLVLSLALSSLLLVSAIVFGAWSYSSRQDYKYHSDQKARAAATVATQEESTLKDKQFAEEEKNPLKSYSGPEAYGSMIVQYPKTWSGYVDDTGQGSALVDGYFNPGVVPSIGNQSSIFALRVQVLATPYSQTMTTLASAQQGRSGQAPLKIVPYALPKVPKVVGVEASGPLPGGGSGSTIGTGVYLPLRSQTLEIWTMGTQSLSDFNNYILPNFSFSP